MSAKNDDLRLLSSWPRVPWDHPEGQPRKRPKLLTRAEAPKYLVGNPYVLGGFR